MISCHVTSIYVVISIWAISWLRMFFWPYWSLHVLLLQGTFSGTTEPLVSQRLARRWIFSVHDLRSVSPFTIIANWKITIMNG